MTQRGTHRASPAILLLVFALAGLPVANAQTESRPTSDCPRPAVAKSPIVRPIGPPIVNPASSAPITVTVNCALEASDAVGAPPQPRAGPTLPVPVPTSTPPAEPPKADTSPSDEIAHFDRACRDARRLFGAALSPRFQQWCAQLAAQDARTTVGMWLVSGIAMLALVFAIILFVGAFVLWPGETGGFSFRRSIGGFGGGSTGWHLSRPFIALLGGISLILLAGLLALHVLDPAGVTATSGMEKGQEPKAPSSLLPGKS